MNTKITIYRPAQIGGQITKIETANASIIIDLGHNLPGTNEHDAYDTQEAITTITQDVDAIFYTHYHGDHIGLGVHVPADIPQYMGKVAKEIAICKYSHLTYIPEETAKQDAIIWQQWAKNLRTYEARKIVQIGDIQITPFMVSHSAYDAYMLLIQTPDKRILFTGDFRTHGYLGKGVEKVLRTYVKQVDVLIIEGTMLSRTEDSPIPEASIQKMASDVMTLHKYVFVQCSSTDLERLASIYAAARKAKPKSLFVVDDYQAEILRTFANTAGKVLAKKSGKERNLFTFDKVCTYVEKSVKLYSRMIEDGFVLLVRPTEKFERIIDSLMPAFSKLNTAFLYSQWLGYLQHPDCKMDSFIHLQEKLERAGASWFACHTSGHASTEALRMVCEITHPTTAIIPIHHAPEADFARIGLADNLTTKIVTQDTESITFKY